MPLFNLVHLDLATLSHDSKIPNAIKAKLDTLSKRLDLTIKDFLEVMHELGSEPTKVLPIVGKATGELNFCEPYFLEILYKQSTNEEHFLKIIQILMLVLISLNQEIPLDRTTLFFKLIFSDVASKSAKCKQAGELCLRQFTEKLVETGQSQDSCNFFIDKLCEVSSDTLTDEFKNFTLDIKIRLVTVSLDSCDPESFKSFAQNLYETFIPVALESDDSDHQRLLESLLLSAGDLNMAIMVDQVLIPGLFSKRSVLNIHVLEDCINEKPDLISETLYNSLKCVVVDEQLATASLSLLVNSVSALCQLAATSTKETATNSHPIHKLYPLILSCLVEDSLPVLRSLDSLFSLCLQVECIEGAESIVNLLGHWSSNGMKSRKFFVNTLHRGLESKLISQESWQKWLIICEQLISDMKETSPGNNSVTDSSSFSFATSIVSSAVDTLFTGISSLETACKLFYALAAQQTRMTVWRLAKLKTILETWDVTISPIVGLPLDGASHYLELLTSSRPCNKASLVSWLDKEFISKNEQDLLPILLNLCDSKQVERAITAITLSILKILHFFSFPSRLQLIERIAEIPDLSHSVIDEVSACLGTIISTADLKDALRAITVLWKLSENHPNVESLKSLFRDICLGGRDKSFQVRECAITTVISLARISPTSYGIFVFELLLKLAYNPQGNKVNVSDSSAADSNQKLIVHHSRDSPEKQASHLKSLAVKGLADIFPLLTDSDDSKERTEALLKVIQETFTACKKESIDAACSVDIDSILNAIQTDPELLIDEDLFCALTLKHSYSPKLIEFGLLLFKKFSFPDEIQVCVASDDSTLILGIENEIPTFMEHLFKIPGAIASLLSKRIEDFTSDTHIVLCLLFIASNPVGLESVIDSVTKLVENPKFRLLAIQAYIALADTMGDNLVDVTDWKVDLDAREKLVFAAWVLFLLKKKKRIRNLVENYFSDPLILEIALMERMEIFPDDAVLDWINIRRLKKLLPVKNEQPRRCPRTKDNSLLHFIRDNVSTSSEIVGRCLETKTSADEKDIYFVASLLHGVVETLPDAEPSKALLVDIGKWFVTRNSNNILS
jgi:hypothetical protein